MGIERRLVGLLDRLPAGDRVGPGDRAARLRLSAARPVADLRGDERLRAAAAHASATRLSTSCAASGPAAAGTRAATTATSQSARRDYLEPQPWAILAGAPDADQARTLVGNVERFLQGRGAPASSTGRRGSAPRSRRRAADPEVTEFDAVTGVGDGNAVFVGGTWYALNGPLTGRSASSPARSRTRAQQGVRRAQAQHAGRPRRRAYPDHWSGILNVDDACNSFYSSAPDQCGIGLLLDLADRDYNGQITHQPAWGLLAALQARRDRADRTGYSFAPTLPLHRFSIRLPRVGIEVAPGSMRGYVRTVSAAKLRLELDPPGNARRDRRGSGSTAGRRTPGLKNGIATVTARPGPRPRRRLGDRTKGAPAA